MTDSEPDIEVFEIVADLDHQTSEALRLEIRRLVRAYGGSLEEFRVEAAMDEEPPGSGRARTESESR